MKQKKTTSTTGDLDHIKNLSWQESGIVSLIYVAIVLCGMEYFFIPPRLESILRDQKIGWIAPSLEAGVGWSLSCILFFFVGPLLLLRTNKKDISKFGFSLQNLHQHMKVYLGLFLLMSPALYFASTQPEFQAIYPFVAEAKKSIPNFLIWELFYILQFFALEFFFRGFLLYTVEERANRWLAIGVMVVPYAMIHFHKPALESFGAIVAGIVLGHLSLKYRSWIGGAILHSLVALTIDSIAASRAGLFNLF